MTDNGSKFWHDNEP